MKRILGTIVAVAGVLALSSAATAAPFTFDISGQAITYVRSSDTFAANPTFGGGPCPTSMQAEIPNAGGCFRWAMGAGSSVTVDITGSAVTFLGGSWNVHSTTYGASGTIVLTTDSVTTVGAGATGTLVGNQIHWFSLPGSPGSSAGTITCTTLSPGPFPGDNPPGSGSNCGLIGMTPGVPVTPAYPFIYGIANNTPVAALDFGWWILDSATYPTAIIKSALVTTTTTNVVDEPNKTSFAVSMASSVPEPSSAALLLLGLGALALRSRKA